MKKLIFTLASLFFISVSASAMSYRQARQQALFLTDKMAYELNLTDDQYEAAYEINLDYLMRIDDYDDLYGVYWNRRNMDLSYILFDWQYRLYCDATYFYRPLYWNAGYWHFSVYARYPRRDYFYFGTPRFYTVYRGGHSWHRNGNRSWYYGRSYGNDYRNNGIGMRDRFHSGYYNNGSRSFGNGPQRRISTYGRGSGNGDMYNRSGSIRDYQNVPDQNSNTVFGGRRSSTRTTVTQPAPNYDGSRSGSFGGSRSYQIPDNRPSVPNRTFTPSESTRPSRQYAPQRSNVMRNPSTPPSRNFGAASRGGRSSIGRSVPRGNGNNNNGSTVHFWGRR